MDMSVLVPFLAMTTMLAAIVFALLSKKRVEEKRADPNAPKSTLAADAPDHRAK